MSSSTAAMSGLLSAQDLLTLINHAGSGKSAFLRVKSFSSIMHSVKWKQRFVILANNEVYIYDSEMSKKPSKCVPLLGYNKVQRNDPNKFMWTFSIVPAVSSVKLCDFACDSEKERREWMRMIKDHMYKANGINRPYTDELNQLARGTEEEYLDLEEPVFTTGELKLRTEHQPDVSDVESVDSSDSDIDDLVSKRSFTRKYSSSSISGGKELPPLPEDDDSPKPPRYSQISSEHTYQNLSSKACDKEEENEKPQSPTSLVDRCLVTDPNWERNRERCVSWLQTKSSLGVYLLRKSRHDNYLVLAVLTEDSEVKEYRLDERSDAMYRLVSKNNCAEFMSLEDLLRHFTTKAFLPGIKHFLTFGIFECKDDTYEDIGITN